MENKCFYCFFRPTFAVTDMLGGILVRPCKCRSVSKRKRRVLLVYSVCIQLLFFVHFCIVIDSNLCRFPDYDVNLFRCVLKNRIGKSNYTLFIHIIYFIESLGATHWYFVLKTRKFDKIPITIPNNREEILRRIQNYLLAFSGLLFLVFTTVTTMFSGFVAEGIEAASTKFRGIVCAVILNISFVYELALLASVSMIGFIILVSTKEVFGCLSERLYLANVNSNEYKIDYIMSEHAEICRFFDKVNDTWKDMFALGYSIGMLMLGTLVYNNVYKTLNLKNQWLGDIGSLILILIVLFASFVISHVINSIYDNFQEIRKFNINFSRITHKIKLICFMKFFRENAIGFNCGDVLIITKDIPIQTVRALYNTFNSLKGIHDIMNGTNVNCNETIQVYTKLNIGLQS
ncbi:uncharacterized protein LOC111614138 [Centruroides sculpturatus]|uniref:uncharacterized protein LOC111614138 n=1 Tax=Centruroides sculpturatus TaxID=218467 RepID=UPI000C6EC536|nr:uncharacterized protein LOC111614138 [Centruroides sculpturatus]